MTLNPNQQYAFNELKRQNRELFKQRDCLRERNAQLESLCGELLEALESIAGKNDLSDVPDNQIQSAGANALYECELTARAALAHAAQLNRILEEEDRQDDNGQFGAGA